MPKTEPTPKGAVASEAGGEAAGSSAAATSDRFHLRAFRRGSLEVAEHLLPLAGVGSRCRVVLEALPGADALHLPLSQGENLCLRVEIPAYPGETVVVELEVEAEGRLHAWSPGRTALTLPPEERYEPPPPIQPATGDRLDLAFLVDGTLRRWRQEKETEPVVPPTLLDDEERWSAHVETMLALAGDLAEQHPDCRMAVLAFGDQPSPGATASDLLPRYLLHPQRADERRLYPFDAKGLRKALLALPSTSGGDFVDALADGLHACRQLRWRPGARKLVVVSGDSPGYSVLEPGPRGIDAGTRTYDVEGEAHLLHRQGVEIATLYHEPPEALGLHQLKIERQLLEHVRRQYTRLASLPVMAFAAAGFAAAAAAAVLRKPTAAIARGAALGVLVDGPGPAPAP